MAFEYRFNVIRFYSKLNRFVLSPRKKPNHFVLKIRPGGFADYIELRLKSKMENNETHIIRRILKGETALYENFLNQYGQQVFSLIARIICN